MAAAPAFPGLRIKCAVRWIPVHAAEYKLDPDRIGITGISSGRHLALMAAVSPSNPVFESEFCEHAATRASIEDADPIRAAGASTVPVLMAHPANDFFVPMSNEQLYYNALIADGRDADLLRLDRGGHFTNAEGLAAQTYSEIQMFRWFDRHLQGATVTLPCGSTTVCDVVGP